MLLLVLKVKKLLKRFTKRDCKAKRVCSLKSNQKRKGDQIYVKWEDQDSYFSSWIDKKDIFI